MSQTQLLERRQPNATIEPVRSPLALASESRRSIDASPQRSRPLSAFWRLFAGNGISSVGDGLVLVAFPLLALTLTTSPVLIAGVAIAGRLPALFLSIPGGALVDRVDRRRLVTAINAVRIVALTAFTAAVLAGHDTLVALYATVFVLGTADMMFNVATQACLPVMVAADELPRANGYLATAELSGEQFIGPAVGGVALAASRALPFVADAVSFVASLFLVRSALPETIHRRHKRPFARDIKEGLVWFFHNPLLRLLAVVVASLAFCQAMVFAELVVYGTRQLHLSHAGYGLFFAVAATGNVLGSLWASRVHSRFGPARSLVGAAVLAGAAYLVLSMTSAVGLAAAVLFVEGVGVAIGNVTTLSLRQRVIPHELLGRVGAAFRLLLYGLVPIGALTGGLLTATLGVRHAFGIAGALQLILLVLAAPVLVRRINLVSRCWANPAAAVSAARSAP
jgi:MFS family permease